jgi:hypothetical protein
MQENSAAGDNFSLRFFALQRKEMVEERPFMAARRSVLVKGAFSAGVRPSLRY